jgi:hypothetical protein
MPPQDWKNKQSIKPWWEAKIDYHICESRQEMPPSNEQYEMIIQKAAGRTKHKTMGKPQHAEKQRLMTAHHCTDVCEHA